MNKENTLKLLTDFPDLYSAYYDRSKPLAPMVFGFECGDGWMGIIYTLSKKISKLDPDCRAMQVKEKFGGLRFYTGGVNREVSDEVWKLIGFAEELSYITCEKCGSLEDVTQSEMGWIYTLCKKCWDERNKENEM
jgi:hypothetical protein